MGSIPITRSKISQYAVSGNAHIAQSVEHVLGKDEVIGSIPIVGPNFAVSSTGGNRNRTDDLQTIRIVFDARERKRARISSIPIVGTISNPYFTTS